MESSPRSSETVVAESVWVRVLMWIGFPLLGAGVGWLLKSVAGWAASLPWAPFQGLFQVTDRLIGSFGEPWATVGAVLVGAVAGLVLAFIAEAEMLVVGVSRESVNLKRDDSSKEIERASIRAVFLDGKELVVLGHSGEELARERTDLDADRLRDAFITHGYRWLAEGDPYKDEYRLWVEDTPDLPPGANALLKVRAKALHKDDGKEEATALREELAKMNVVVRDDNTQYWRRSGGAILR